MKLRKLFFTFCFISLAAAGFADDNTDELKKKFADAKSNLSSSLSSASEGMLDQFEIILPEANSLSGVQPDAYIGKLFPSLLPHFAVGINASVTPVKAAFISENMDKISSAVSTMFETTGAISGSGDFSFDFQFPDTLPYPAASLSARVGGIILPFDIGLWGVTTGKIFHEKSIGNSPVFDFDYTAIGADLRYAVLEGAGLFPKISVGGGYQFARQNIGVSFAKDFTLDSGFEDADGNTYTTDAKIDTAFNMKVDTHTFFGQVQVSKTLLIVTPYLGLKALFTKSDCSYNWKYETYAAGTKIADLSDSADIAYKHTFSEVGIQTQVFGGLSLNFALFQTSLNAAYNFSTQMFTGSLGMNLKL